MKKFYFLPQNCFYSFDIYANNIKEAKNKIRSILDKKTLHGVQVWAA
jgi:hypothetical protein